jgi:hypothetical protein
MVGQVGERASVGVSALLEGFGGYEQRRNQTAADQEHAHDRRRTYQQLARVADAPAR